MKTRVLYYEDEGYFPQARRKYGSWTIIKKRGDSFELCMDWSNPYAGKPAANNVCSDYRDWFNDRAEPVVQ